MTSHRRMHLAWTARSRSLVLAAAVGATVLLGAGPATAHVRVTPSTAAPGEEATELSFGVPNERSDATTTRVELVLPTEHPVAFASVRPMPGWRIQVVKQKLDKPLTSDDGPVTEAVSRIIWSDGSIGPGEYQDFDVTIGPLPETPTTMVFKALQTYSDGSVARWIDVTPASGAEPEHPAPVLQVRADATPGPDASSAPGRATRTAATAAATNSVDWTTRGLAGAGLLIALAALALALRGRQVTSSKQLPVTVPAQARPAAKVRK